MERRSSEPQAERRKEPRLKTNQPVTLTLLGEPMGPRPQVCEGCVLDVSGIGLRIRTPGPLPCGAPVRVDAKEMLMLGEVCRCEPEGGAYTVGIELSHSLGGLGELEKLNHALMGGRLWRDLATEAKHPARDPARTRS